MPKDVNIVIGSGAGGGLVSWAFTIMTGAGATFGLDKWFALPLCVILGVAASLVAVYVITPTDVSKTGRLIGFALLCGFLWKPVLDAGRVVINQHIEVAQASAQLKANVNELKAAGRAAPADIGTTAHEVASDTVEVLRTSDRLDNPKLEERATEQASEAVNAIAETSSENPVAAAIALDEIRTAAEVSDNSFLVDLATEKLEMIERSAPRDLAPMIPPPNRE